MKSKEALENLTYCVNGMEIKEKYYKRVKQDLDKLEKVKNLISLIEEKIENAENHLSSIERNNDYYEVKGQALAYCDVLLLLRGVFGYE